MRDEDGVDLPQDDFRRERRYLAPHVFALPGTEADRWPEPSDLVEQADWESIMDLPTDVALKSCSYEGSVVSTMNRLQADWVDAWPPLGDAPFMEDVSLLAGGEFEALVFNAIHGCYRQAVGCLRNAFEIMMVGAALAVTSDADSFDQWRAGTKEYRFQATREMLSGSPEGQAVDRDASPHSVFGDDPTSWSRTRYATLCAYAHSRPGYNNADFWESNGPIFVPSALHVVEAEMRETLALCYLLLRLGWPGYTPGPGPANLLQQPMGNWHVFRPILGSRLL